MADTDVKMRFEAIDDASQVIRKLAAQIRWLQRQVKTLQTGSVARQLGLLHPRQIKSLAESFGLSTSQAVAFAKEMDRLTAVKNRAAAKAKREEKQQYNQRLANIGYLSRVRQSSERNLAREEKQQLGQKLAGFRKISALRLAEDKRLAREAEGQRRAERQRQRDLFANFRKRSGWMRAEDARLKRAAMAQHRLDEALAMHRGGLRAAARTSVSRIGKRILAQNLIRQMNPRQESWPALRRRMEHDSVFGGAPSSRIRMDRGTGRFSPAGMPSAAARDWSAPLARILNRNFGVSHDYAANSARSLRVLAQTSVESAKALPQAYRRFQSPYLGSPFFYSAMATGVASALTGKALRQHMDEEYAEYRTRVYGLDDMGSGPERNAKAAELRQRFGERIAMKYGIPLKDAMDTLTETLKAGIPLEIAETLAEEISKATFVFDGLNMIDTTKLIARVAQFRRARDPEGKFDIDSLKSELNDIAIAIAKTAADANEVIQGMRRGIGAGVSTNMSMGDIATFLGAAITGGTTLNTGRFVAFLTNELVAAGVMRGQRREDLDKGLRMIGMPRGRTFGSMMANDGRETLMEVLRRLNDLEPEKRAQAAYLIGMRQWRSQLLTLSSMIHVLDDTFAAQGKDQGREEKDRLFNQLVDERLELAQTYFQRIQVGTNLMFGAFGKGISDDFKEFARVFARNSTQFRRFRFSDISKAILDGIVKGLGFKNISEALESIFPEGTADFFSDIQIDNIKEFFSGFAEGFREVFSWVKSSLEQMATFIVGDASAESIGKVVGMFIALTFALQFLSPVVSTLAASALLLGAALGAIAKLIGYVLFYKKVSAIGGALGAGGAVWKNMAGFGAAQAASPLMAKMGGLASMLLPAKLLVALPFILKAVLLAAMAALAIKVIVMNWDGIRSHFERIGRALADILDAIWNLDFDLFKDAGRRILFGQNLAERAEERAGKSAVENTLTPPTWAELWNFFQIFQMMRTRNIDGARAKGGPVRAGGAYLVGEQGPEIIVPHRAGMVIPNDQIFGNLSWSAMSLWQQAGMRSLFNGEFGGARAMGGHLRAGMSYLVGEMGPELVVPANLGGAGSHAAAGARGKKKFWEFNPWHDDSNLFNEMHPGPDALRKLIEEYGRLAQNWTLPEGFDRSPEESFAEALEEELSLRHQLKMDFLRGEYLTGGFEKWLEATDILDEDEFNALRVDIWQFLRDYFADLPRLWRWDHGQTMDPFFDGKSMFPPAEQNTFETPGNVYGAHKAGFSDSRLSRSPVGRALLSSEQHLADLPVRMARELVKELTGAGFVFPQGGGSWGGVSSGDIRAGAGVSSSYSALGGSASGAAAAIAGPAARLSGSVGQRGQELFNMLKADNWSDAQAAALVGHMITESTLNPTAFNRSEGAFGLLQWRDNRLANLKTFAQSQGLDYRSMEAQARFIRHEMETDPYERRKSGAFRASTDNVDAAADALRPYIRYGSNTAAERRANARAVLAGSSGGSTSQAALGGAAVTLQAGKIPVKMTDGSTQWIDPHAGFGQAFAGGSTHAGVLAIAQDMAANNIAGGLNRFTGFNDAFHAGRNSMHAHGLAGDFTIQDPRQSAQAAQQLRDRLSSLGLMDGRDFRVIDEYARPSPFSTGGHIHWQFQSAAAAQIAAQALQNQPALPDTTAIAAANSASRGGGVTAGPITINVSGTGDPEAVARAVSQKLETAMRSRTHDIDHDPF